MAPTAPIDLAHLTEAQDAASGLDALILNARTLANSIQTGHHGRRRAGVGEAFWQYRPAQAGDTQRQIDWRRSGQGDALFVRENEMQIAQNLQIWIEPGASMQFGSTEMHSKSQVAQILGLAIAQLALDAGERVGILGAQRPSNGAFQLRKLAELCSQSVGDRDHCLPDPAGLIPRSELLIISDFLGDWAPWEGLFDAALRLRVRPVLLMLLDPIETKFPFRGRTRFQSASNIHEYETNQARDLRGAYLDRLEQRKAALRQAAETLSGRSIVVQTDEDLSQTLMALHGVLGRERRGS